MEFFMINLLLDGAGTYAPWISASFPIIEAIIGALAIVLALTITIIVLVMDSDPEGGANVITGSNESFYSKNMASSKEGRLKRAIVICSIAIAVLVVAFWILWRIYPNK